MGEAGGEELFLALEMEIDDADGKPRRFGHVGHGQGGIALARQDRDGGVNQLLPPDRP